MCVAIQDIDCFEVKCAFYYEGTNNESNMEGKEGMREPESD